MKSVLAVILISLLFYTFISCAAGPHEVVQLGNPPENPPALSKMTSLVKVGGDGIRLVSDVTSKGVKFLYSYELKNIGEKTTWLVSSSIPDRAMGLSGVLRDSHHCFLLKPGESTTINILHEDSPEEFQGNIKCFVEESRKGFYKDRDIDVEILGVKPKYYFSMTAAAVGYIPKSLKPKRK